MNYQLFFIFLIIIVAVALASLKKAGKAAIAIVSALVVIVGLCAVVIFIPSSKLSIWVTENIAPFIEFDSGNIYNDGDAIITLKVLEEEGSDRKKTKITAYSDYDDVKKATQDFINERISAVIERRLENLEETYVLSFKDAYMLLVPGKTSFSIIKGEPPEEY